MQLICFFVHKFSPFSIEIIEEIRIIKNQNRVKDCLRKCKLNYHSVKIYDQTFKYD